MKNKHVGLLIVGVAILFFFVVMSFNQALQKIVDVSCTHGVSCPMHATVQTQQIISYGLMGLLVLVGLFMTFFVKDAPQQITKQELSAEEKQEKIKHLDEDEKQIVNVLMFNNGSTYQSDLIKETGMTKVKMSRVLDKLQGRGLIERHRRGMTNAVILK